jgi:cytochrome c-type biogenesis protein CcmE
MKKGTLENKFVLTDFKNDIMVVYKGSLPATFREGDMASVGGFLADHKNPSCFIGTTVAANHDIAADRWLGDTRMDKQISMNMIETDQDFEYTKMR